MKVTETALQGVLLIEPRLFRDARGFFMETFQVERYAEIGLTSRFVQDNCSYSARGTLRGLHFQEPKAQGKLVQVLSGAVLDVVVDVRRGSPTFGHWIGVPLEAETGHQLWIPPGFAHGFCVTSETALFVYKCTALYAPECERTVVWNDPDLGIDWPFEAPLLSPRDAAATRLREIAELPVYDAGGSR
jgi:dTDP-4-dehydrorhamnose 3,5-epimerase